LSTVHGQSRGFSRGGTCARLGRRLAALALALVAFSAAVAVAQVTFEAAVDRTQVTMNDQLTLTLSVSGAGVRGAEPQLPSLSGFSVAGRASSQQISFVNGRVSTNLQYSYTLVPTRAGKQAIPAATLNVNGQVYRTKPIAVTVAGGGTTQPRQPAQPSQPSQPAGPAAPMPPGHSEDTEGGYVFVKAAVDKTQVYVNEQVTLDIAAHRDSRFAWSRAQFSQPETTGFVGYDLPKPDPAAETLNGVEYVRVPCMRQALFPAAAGKLTIGASTLQFTTDFFNADARQVSSKPLTITVLPLPEAGKPAGFGGAVGQFHLEASADKTALQTGQTVTLKVTVTGTGNIATATEPSLGDLAKFKQFNSNQSEQTSTQGLKLGGTKEFEFVLMPVEPGRLALGPVTLAYFDPTTKTYCTAKAEPIAFEVTQGAADQSVDSVTGFTKDEIRLLKKDINYIRPDAKRLADDGRVLYRRPGFLLLNLLPLLGLGGASLYRRQQLRLANDAEYQRKRRGRETAAKSLGEAEQCLRRGRSAAEFYAALSKGLRELVGARLNLPPSAVSADTTPTELRARGADAALVARVEASLRQSELGRFTPSGGEPTAMEQALAAARQCVSELERAEV